MDSSLNAYIGTTELKSKSKLTTFAKFVPNDVQMDKLTKEY